MAAARHASESSMVLIGPFPYDGRFLFREAPLGFYLRWPCPARMALVTGASPGSGLSVAPGWLARLLVRVHRTDCGTNSRDVVS